MNTFFKLAAAAALSLSLGLGYACSSDSGGGESDAGGDGSGTATFMATLVDFQSKAPKEGVDLEVLDNATGELLDPVAFPPFKSGPDGKIALDLPPGIQVGFKASGEDTSGYFIFKDSYQFNIESDAQDETIYAVNQLTYAAALSTGFVAQMDAATFGHLAGTLYYVTADGEEDFVGCAKFEVTDEDGNVLVEENDDPDGRATYCGIRYFDTGNDMPTSLEVSDMTHLLNSRYMVANLPAGQYTVTARELDNPDNVLGSVTLRAYPGALSIGNIYVYGDTNPTPGDEICIGEEAP